MTFLGYQIIGKCLVQLNSTINNLVVPSILFVLDNDDLGRLEEEYLTVFPHSRNGLPLQCNACKTAIFPLIRRLIEKRKKTANCCFWQEEEGALFCSGGKLQEDLLRIQS